MNRMLTLLYSLLHSEDSDDDDDSDFQPARRRPRPDVGSCTRRFLNLDLPEHSGLRGQMRAMEHFYTDPVCLRRRGRKPIAPITWKRVQLHQSSE